MRLAPIPRLPFARGALALAFALTAAAAGAQPPKEPDKKEPTQPTEPKWPTEIGGRDIAAVLKELQHDPDPTVREFAARTLPNFGPAAAKPNVSGVLVQQMSNERDPGVRYAIYGAVGAIPFESEKDNTEALRQLITAVDRSGPGSAARYRAVQTLAMFGSRGESSVTALTGIAMRDTSYETRRAIANALGRVGFGERTGPNMRALTALADVLAKDPSAAVRMEALQSILLVGPPWAELKKPDAKVNPPIKADDAATIIRYMKARVGDPVKNMPGIEKDKQVEIWARLVLMRFDPKEINDANLDALAQHLTGAEIGVKIQALNAIGIMGELAAKKIDAVRQVLNEKEQPRPLTAAVINVLVAMGAGAKPAVPDLKKLADAARASFTAAKQKEAEKKAGTDQDAADQAAVTRSVEENWLKLIEAAIKRIDDAKPISPADLPPADPKKP